MGFVGSLINGGNSGDSGGAGFNYQAKGATDQQQAASWGGTQSALGQQAAFAAATGDSNGLGNQSSVFQQQQALANNLQGQANGTAGPSIAQLQYQQNMNQISAQQSGSIGSQKGISPALQARMIAQQGAGAQQAAAGQGATLGAQEQWAATQALQQQQANMANLSTQQVGQQANAINAQTQGQLGQQSNLFGLQSGATAANAGVAGKTIGGQEKLVGSLFGGAAMAHGGLVRGYADGGQVDLYSPAPIGSQISSPDAPLSGAGRALAYGNQVAAPAIQMGSESAGGGGQGNPGLIKWVYNQFNKTKPEKPVDPANAGADYEGSSQAGFQSGNGVTAENAPVDMGDGAAAGSVSGGAVESADIGASAGALDAAATALYKGGAVKNYAMGGDTSASDGGGSKGIMQMLPMLAMLLNQGGRVPTLNGEAYANAGMPVPGKAKVGGDSLKNDTVPARLSPGEVIIPRSIMNSKDPPKAAAKMVRDIIAKKKKAGNGL